MMDSYGESREEDNFGNDQPDIAADDGRRHQSALVIDATRTLVNPRCYWCPVVLQLHTFMIAVSRAAVNHDGRAVCDPDLVVFVRVGSASVVELIFMSHPHNLHIAKRSLCTWYS